MKKVILAALLCAVSVSSIARPLTTEEQAAVEKGMEDVLKDPYSAHYSHGDFPYPDTFIYCGQVNSKNAYGAYTGKKLFSMFIAKNKDNKTIAALVGNIDGDEEITKVTCDSAGYEYPVPKTWAKQINQKRKESGIAPLDKARFY
ncbi:hypothetical protein ACVOZ6_004693 [Escherichia coli]